MLSAAKYNDRGVEGDLDFSNSALESPNLETVMDWRSGVPGGWIWTNEAVPQCFCFPGGSAGVIRPLARGHLEPLAPLEARHTLLCLPKSMVNMTHFDSYVADWCFTPPFCRVFNVIDEPGYLIAEFDHPRGSSVQGLQEEGSLLDEASGQICCKQLMDTLSTLHRHSLWLRSCIHASTVFVLKDGTLVSMVPWGLLLSSQGLSIITADGASDGVAPEVRVALAAESRIDSTQPHARAMADTFAAISLVLQALMAHENGKANDLAKLAELPELLCDLALRATQQDPQYRLDVAGVLRHPWLEGAAGRANGG